MNLVSYSADKCSIILLVPIFYMTSTASDQPMDQPRSMYVGACILTSTCAFISSHTGYMLRFKGRLFSSWFNVKKQQILVNSDPANHPNHPQNLRSNLQQGGSVLLLIVPVENIGVATKISPTTHKPFSL